MTEIQKRRKLIKIIRVQWLVIFGLLIAVIVATVFACIPDPVAPAGVSFAKPETTDTSETTKIVAMPLVSSSHVVSAADERICLGRYKLTAYCPCEKCCDIWSEEHESRKGTSYVQRTASGTIPKEGRTVAVDTSVIPFGTTVIIDGHEYVAEDRGGAVKENVIDIFFENHEDAVNFGVQYKTIYIKGENHHD